MMERHPVGIPPAGRSAIAIRQAGLQLNNGNHVRLSPVQDLRLTATRGIAWITLEGEAGEAFVRPGEIFVLAKGKTALIGPLHESVSFELGVVLDAIVSQSCARSQFERAS